MLRFKLDARGRMLRFKLDARGRMLRFKLDDRGGTDTDGLLLLNELDFPAFTLERLKLFPLDLNGF